MSQNELHTLQLQINLSQFGLNPNEWSLRQLTQFSYVIAHKEDPEFKMKGLKKKRKGEAIWQKLQLLSL